jgi:hypothetical protein
VQRGLGVPVGLCTGEPGVDVGACRHKHSDGLGPAGKCAGQSATTCSSVRDSSPSRSRPHRRSARSRARSRAPACRAAAGAAPRQRRCGWRRPPRQPAAHRSGWSTRCTSPVSCRLARYVASAAESCATLGAPAVRCSPW